MGKVFLWLILSLSLYAEVLSVGLKESYSLQHYMTYTLAKDINETPEMLTSRIWKPDKSSFDTLENFAKPYWAKIEIKNSSSLPQTYYFKSENQFTYYINFFLLKDNKVVSSQEDGLIAFNHERIFNVNHMIFPLELAPKEEATVLFKVQNYNKIDLNFRLETKEYLLDFYQTYNILEGIFLGGMGMMIFYNLFLFSLLRCRVYIYYILYTFWISVYFFGLFGFFQRYFFDLSWIFSISTNLFFIFMILFIQTIFNLKNKIKKVHTFFNFLIFYFILSLPLYMYALKNEEFLYAEIIFNVSFFLIAMLMLLTIGVTYYLAYKKNEAIAKTYLLIWTIIFLGGLMPIFVYLNIIQLGFHIHYIIQFIVLLEVLFFAFVLAYKVKIIEKEKNHQRLIFDNQNKFVAMGEMISTIAHQWRQPLSEINGIVLNMDLDYNEEQLSSKKFATYIKEIEDVHSYLDNTVNDFINFFDHDKEVTNFFITDVFNHMKRLLLISRKEEIVFSFFVDNIEVYGYKSELLQALLIIMNNAIDAGTLVDKKVLITISTRKIDDNNLLISIEDNGGGISPNILENIFNPYFTTKHEFKGTGLGLYILKMIVEESMHGKVHIYNKNLGVICEIIIPINLDKM